MVGNVQGRATLRDDMRELPSAFDDPTPRRAAPKLPADHSLQMDGGLSDDVDGGRANLVTSVGTRGRDEPGGGPSVEEQKDRSHMPVLNRECYRCRAFRLRIIA